jgi:hypothetical protein
MERFAYPESAALIGIAAFCVAASIFIAVAWRALRMKPRQVERLEHLPFETETPASHGPRDPKAGT